jgi:hypothetical protein
VCVQTPFGGSSCVHEQGILQCAGQVPSDQGLYFSISSEQILKFFLKIDRNSLVQIERWASPFKIIKPQKGKGVQSPKFISSSPHKMLKNKLKSFKKVQSNCRGVALVKFLNRKSIHQEKNFFYHCLKQRDQYLNTTLPN